MNYSFDSRLEPLIQVIFILTMGVGIVSLIRTLVADARRRRRLRELAETRQWRFRRYVLSGGRDPYTRFEQVSQVGLLCNVVEGRERGFDFSVFEYCPTPRYRNTGALVQLDAAPVSCRVEFWSPVVSSSVHGLEEALTKIGPRTAAALRKAGELPDSHSMVGLVVEIDSGAVLVRAVRSPLEAEGTNALLDAALSLSAAVVDDERQSRVARHS